MKRLILTALLVLAAASPAPAVTLMVNGDTPARRWQRPFTPERTNVPTPDGRVDLYFAPCPADFDRTLIAGCALIGGGLPAPRIHVEPETVEMGSAAVVTTIAHEQGHIFDELHLTNSDRLRFMQIWRRPVADGWVAELAPPRLIFGSDGYHGVGSRPSEWFADAYQACLLEAAPVDRVEALELIDAKFTTKSSAWRYRRDAFRQIAATCRLIEQAALRPPVS